MVFVLVYICAQDKIYNKIYWKYKFEYNEIFMLQEECF